MNKKEMEMELGKIQTAEEMLEARRFQFKPKKQVKTQAPEKYSSNVVEFLERVEGATAVQIAVYIQKLCVTETYTLLRKMERGGVIMETGDGLFHLVKEGMV
jgi:hypothetical protein